jgi:AcrR family transcriptional regulator
MISIEAPSPAPRRTEGKRTQGRSARVLESVLETAAEELGRVGFSALRVEHVAARSGVHKTTIYRRWPTKLDLVAAVLEHQAEPPASFDTGSLASDVRACLFDLRTRLYTARHRGIVQVLQGERAHPEVAQLVSRLRERQAAVRRQMFERAIARGELPAHSDATLLTEFMTAPMITRIIHLDSDVDDAFIELLATVLCEGAKAAPQTR